MASSIDASKPVLGNASTSDVRQNFTYTKAEIETLQGQVATLTADLNTAEATIVTLQGASGFVDYNDYATSLVPISVGVSTWVKLTNDKLGPYTKTDRLPAGVTSVWNSSTNRIDLTQLPVNSMVEARADLLVTTTAANQIVRFRTAFAIGGVAPFDLEGTANQFKTAGTQKLVLAGSFYVGSNDVKNNPAEFQIFSDAACTVRVNGWYIRISKPVV